jgi:phenylpyruvate tautomerase PptA (4-oxalocrotonate tautomerase family)
MFVNEITKTKVEIFFKKKFSITIIIEQVPGTFSHFR